MSTNLRGPHRPPSRKSGASLKNHANQQPSRAKRFKRALRAKIKKYPRLMGAVVTTLLFVGKPMKRAGQFLMKEAYKLSTPSVAQSSPNSPQPPLSPDDFLRPSRYYVLEREGDYVVYRSKEERDEQAEGHKKAELSTHDSYADIWMRHGSAKALAPCAKSGGTVHAYTDGSICENLKSYAWAAHFVTSEGAVQFSGAIFDASKNSSGVFSAESTAALMAARIAREAGFSKVIIHHDLASVNVNEKGMRKSKKADVVSYRQEMAEEMKLIQVRFVKCSSKPSANPAHQLARQAAKHAKRSIA